MYNQNSSVRCCIFKLITLNNRVFIWKKPFLFAFFSIIFLPCFFHPVFANDIHLLVGSKEKAIVSVEARLKNIESIPVDVVGTFNVGNRGGKSLNKGGENSVVVIDSPDIQSDKRTNQSGNNNDWWSSDAGKKLIEIIQYFTLGALVSWPPMFYALLTTTQAKRKT